MMRLSRGLSLTSLCLSLAACGASKMYTLPVAPDRVSETQANLWTCATQAGLESQAHGSDVTSVKYDETTMLYYRYDGAGAFAFQVIVDDKAVPPDQVEGKLSVARKQGEALYACAQDRANPHYVESAAPSSTTNINVNLNANVSADASGGGAYVSSSSGGASASASVNMSGTCARAVDCYARLAKTVCEGAQDCSFKVELSGNDETSCREALLRVPDLLMPFRMVRPDISAPTVCRAD
ncbi:hypothetical protein LZ198_27670 [Myxococcus sp. K15C18031901]|uniref:hypothetical protein n=1 Tax=Myxococcus dinghuensis TaxID=2906761 RepID=UPI0020A8388C|nr:hypothetical protein [Myxococcus dinghuensis]MCP3102660.1 hypothetical protein [Myxococcus dinghuensis]